MDLVLSGVGYLLIDVVGECVVCEGDFDGFGFVVGGIDEGGEVGGLIGIEVEFVLCYSYVVGVGDDV